MRNFDPILERYILEYSRNKKPIAVSFKDLIPELNNLDRGTHLIHTYPAKLLMHIPHFFVNNNLLSKKGDQVLDSFCGSGTVLLEAMIAGRRPIGADANPLARLISETKTHVFDIKLLSKESEQLIKRIDKRKYGCVPNVVNIDYWFLPQIKKQLSSISNAINEIENPDLSNFYKVCFSNLIKKVSLADPRVSVPVRIKPSNYPEKHVLRRESIQILTQLQNIDVRKKFNEIIIQNIRRFEKLNDLITSTPVIQIESTDARKLMESDKRRLRKDSVQLFISSPPYCGAQKYIRSCSLSLGWLGYTEESTELRELEKKSIGRENYSKNEYFNLTHTGISEADMLLTKIHKLYPQRAHIASNYLLEMISSLKEAVRVLKAGGYMVLVAANNQICGFEFKTQEYLTYIAQSLGLTLVLQLIDDIKSYGLMTKRNKTASVITCEWVIVFQK